jgi:two-component system chemotaxis sensor kinase CheA
MILDPNGLSSFAGQIDAGDSNAQNSHGAAAGQTGDQSSFLLFRAGGTELKAIPLELVSRIEELDAKAIEHVGGRRVIQYGQHLMPLVPFDAGHAWNDQGRQKVLVFSDNDRSMALAVDEVVDIVRDQLTVELSSEHPGLLGSAIIAGKAADIVDLSHFLALAFADWFNIADARAATRRALLVDDSPFFRNLVTPLLTSARWSVTTASDGVEALKLREDGQQFDVIISDIEMPNLNGLALAGAIRSDARWNRVPLIALSSHAGENDVNAGREAGFDDYLAKSDPTRLPETLARALRQAIGRNETDQLRKAS